MCCARVERVAVLIDAGAGSNTQIPRTTGNARSSQPEADVSKALARRLIYCSVLPIGSGNVGINAGSRNLPER